MGGIEKRQEERAMGPPQGGLWLGRLRKVCNLEQGGGPVWPGDKEGKSGVGVVISSQGSHLGEERKNVPPAPDFHI